jgi:hypothetical protein
MVFVTETECVYCAVKFTLRKKWFFPIRYFITDNAAVAQSGAVRAAPVCVPVVVKASVTLREECAKEGVSLTVSVGSTAERVCIQISH